MSWERVGDFVERRKDIEDACTPEGNLS